jgi:hypothetical protein
MGFVTTKVHWRVVYASSVQCTGRAMGLVIKPVRSKAISLVGKRVSSKAMRVVRRARKAVMKGPQPSQRIEEGDDEDAEYDLEESEAGHVKES